MSALPRPDLPPGPHRDLVVELHGLHHRAGWPSLRTLAARTGVSHTTVSKVFSAPALPTWGTLELLVEAMDGDTGEFHRLWLAATDPSDVGPSPAPRIAGRRTELDVVRRHLEEGSGLLLVTGEAGMGKTTLLEAACAQVRDTVLTASGRCLPLSSEVPLLPVADALRQLGHADGGGPAADALRACPSYVREALSALLPEWSAGDAHLPDPDDRWLRQRLFAAVAELCSTVSSSRPFAIVLEDLHWADGLTLDLVEHLVRHGPARVLGSWRTEDPAVPREHREWFGRVRRDAVVVPLASLTADETLEQLRLLRPGASSEDAARIHARSRGQPLFTEQLVHAEAGDPTYLDDLLDGRVGHLAGSRWAVASVLGVADRRLSPSDVARAADVEEGLLTEVLRGLKDERLADIDATGVQLRHPLLAEAVRRRLLPGEAAAVHAAVATLLASTEHAEPAEVARHWQRAGEPDEERVWRVRAARAAAERYAGAQAAEHWRRVLALWPPAAAEVGDPPVRRHEVVAGIAAQLDLAGRARDAKPVLEAELALPEAPPLYHVEERADLLRQLARLDSSQYAGGSRGLELVQQAIELYRTLPPTSGLATALTWKGNELEWHGRREEAIAVLAEAADVAARTGDRMLQRSVLAHRAWQLGASGDIGSVAEIERIMAEFTGDDNPLRTLWVVVRHTDVLLMACRPAQDVARAAQPALDEAETWQITSGHVDVLRTNVAQAWRRAGLVRHALAVIAADTEDEDAPDFSLAHIERANLEVLLGHDEAARRRIQALHIGAHEVLDTFILQGHLLHATWLGEPADGLELARTVLLGRHDEVSPGTAGDLLVLTARAAIDATVGGTVSERRDVARSLDELRAAMHYDPFSGMSVMADRACLPQWDAEKQRLLGRDTVEAWVEAAATWDALDRPHDAAYCRWRAAQAALRDGHGTVAARFLKKAATGAREHVPLTQAIAETAGATGRRGG
ncbi:MAG TPA: AAA family ATPase [Nocardioides sp.]|nr:AAA family ATPase [Nocardioides sp.]